MRNKKKKIFISLIVVLAICQIIGKVSAYTRNEVIDIVDYKVIEEDDEEPTDYDVLVHLDDFEADETIPCFKTSIDTVLYKKYGLFDINFFSDNMENHKLDNGEYDKWVDIRDIVVKVFKVSRYIAFAIMLTLLIYIALILASSSFSGTDSLPMSKQILRAVYERTSITRNTREKRLIEQWFISLLIIAIVPFGLSFIVYSTNAITDLTYKPLNYESSNNNDNSNNSNDNSNKSKDSNNKNETDDTTEEIDCNYIKVYAKYRIKPVAGGIPGSGSYINPVSPLLGKLMMIGDSRTEGLKNEYGASEPNIVWVCKGGEGYTWMMQEGFPTADQLVESGMAVVIWMGVNDGLGSLSVAEEMAQKYVEAISQKANEWGSKGVTVCFASVGPTRDGTKHYAQLMPGIQKFNEYIRSNLPSNVSYIDLYTAIQNKPGGWDSEDGLHYWGNNNATQKYILDYIKSQFGMGGTSSIATASSSGTSTSSGNLALSAELRQKVVDQAKTLDNLGAKGGYCEMWVESVYRKALNRESGIDYQCCAHKAGQNSIVSTNTDDIIPGAAVFSYRSSSGTRCSACGQDAGHVGIYIGDGKIASCTGRGDTGIVIHTIDEWKQSWEFSGWGWLPGTTDLADGATPDGGGNLSNSVTVDDTEYTFKTSLEGLMDYETQYNSEDTRLQALSCFIIKIALTVFKYFLFIIFLIRMLVIAVITAFSPILALINAFMKITKGKDILKNTFIIYAYLALIKPAIGLVYELLIREHITWHESNPITILPVIIGIIILVIWSYIKLRESLKIKGLGETIKHKIQIVKERMFGF